MANSRLAELRDDLHDAKLSGDNEATTSIEESIKAFTELKSALLEKNRAEKETK